MAKRRERFRISGGQTSLVVSPMAGSSAARSPDGRTSWSATREWAPAGRTSLVARRDVLPVGRTSWPTGRELVPAGRTTNAPGGADLSVRGRYGRSNVDNAPSFLLATASLGAASSTSSPDVRTGLVSIRNRSIALVSLRTSWV